MSAAEAWAGWCAMSVIDRAEFAITLTKLGVLTREAARQLVADAGSVV